MRIFGTSMLNLTAKKFFKQQYRPGALAVNIGSGTHTIDPNVFNLDLFPYKRVDITADICNLPFKNNSVDLIICEEVLEHLPDPDSALREMSRILKTTGRIYMNVPFIMQYHSSPHDYQRWTKYGVRQMMSKYFTVTNLGIAYGPTSALVLVLISWLAILLSFGSQKIYNVCFITFQILLAPWCHLLDQVLGRLETAENMNCGFYCEGENSKLRELPSSVPIDSTQARNLTTTARIPATRPSLTRLPIIWPASTWLTITRTTIT